MPLGIDDQEEVNIEREAREAGFLAERNSFARLRGLGSQGVERLREIKNQVLAKRRKRLSDKNKQLITRKQAPGREQTLLSTRSENKNLLGGF